MSEIRFRFRFRFTYLFFLFIFSIAIPIKVIHSQRINDELAVLLNLKQQLGNPPSIASWNSSSSPCDWPEINCTAGSVTHLHLREKNITATIPPSICDLKNLSFLNLALNFIPGEFPVTLYNCSKLQFLDLSQNYFTGQIPSDIDRLSALVSLDISGNNFSGNIPPSIGKFPGLQRLYMHLNLFNGTFPKEISNLSNLEELGMAYNPFIPMEIPREFGFLKKLWYLWMAGTNLIGEIPESFNNLSSLQQFDLSINNLEGPIPSGLFSFENLTLVYLFKNHLSNEIPNEIDALNLVEVDLSENNLTGKIPEGFGKLESLRFFNLFSNQLTGELPAGIASLPALRDFRVFQNKLTGVLPSEFGIHSKLKGFEVSDNQFSGQLPRNLCAGGVLQGLVAHTNNLEGEIPRSLGDCRSLLNFQLQNNRFSGEIPSGLWRSFNLSVLTISNNSFSGELPSEIAWNMSRVEISDNKFSGGIPAGISSWSSLVVFKASNNLFSGEIPKEITSLSKLITLLLDGNEFSGELPSEIISWESLITLNVSNNKLSGQIPAAIGSLPDLINLDLSENQFAGEIPYGIGNLRPTSLNLSSNKLSGKIPEQLDNPAYGNSFLNNVDLCADDPKVKLRDCNSISKHDRRPKKLSSKYVAVIVSLVVPVSIVMFLVVFFIIRDYKRKKSSQNSETWKLTSFQRLNFSEGNILSNLVDDNLVGVGGSGKVYRIEIDRSGESVAVKKIGNCKKLDHKLEQEFSAEVEILGSIRHLNIVKLLCCISSEDSKLLVYEYMENRSLDRWLHGNQRSFPSRRAVLDWQTRLKIAVGAAQGLCYMHHECPTPIIHRDVKSSNILLDYEFNAKIADFGLAKILAKHASSYTMSTVAGSFGYLAPEYAYTTKVDTKVDVYSFGVVLLELVTGREANSVNGVDVGLVEWARQHSLEDKSIAEVLDPEVKESSCLEEMIMVYKVGIVCTRASPSTRPSMKEVLHVLRCWCWEDGRESKRVGSEFDVSPLLGGAGAGATYFSSYKGGKRSEEGNNKVYSV